MTNKEYQEFVNSINLTHTSQYLGGYEANAMHLICGLTEEVGEYVGLHKRWYRDEKNVPTDKALSELGDILWYLTALMTAHGFTLDQVISENIKKLSRRRVNNTIQGSGDR